MSWNGSGTFNRLYSWVADRTAGLDISSTRMDADTNDITSNGFANCLTRDGQGIATANLPMGAFRHTGVGNGVARTDYAAMGQVQDGLVNWAGAGGSADALTVTLSPAPSALVDGQLVFVRAAAANATTTPTLAVNGSPATTITKRGGSALVAGDIPGAGAECIFRCNIAGRFELLNPAVSSAYGAGTVTNAALANASAWTLKGNNSGSSAAPSDFTIDSLSAKSSPTGADEALIWDAAATAMKKATLSSLASAVASGNTAPTVQRFTTGSSLTYTPAAGIARIRVRMAGGGGGGATANNGSGGGDTSFGSWTALHGGGGVGNDGSPGAGGTGGVNGTGTLVARIGGGGGAGGHFNSLANVALSGGNGGNSAFGGGGTSQQGQSGGTASANSGAGSGGGGGDASTNAGPGGGAGEYVEFWMTAAQVGASQTYTVGTGGGGGAAGANAGGNGAAGIIIVEEFYT